MRKVVVNTTPLIALSHGIYISDSLVEMCLNR